MFKIITSGAKVNDVWPGSPSRVLHIALHHSFMFRATTGQRWELHSVPTHGKCIEKHWMMDKIWDRERTSILNKCSFGQLTKPLAIMRYRPFSDSMSLLVKRNWTIREFLNRWPKVVYRKRVIRNATFINKTEVMCTKQRLKGVLTRSCCGISCMMSFCGHCSVFLLRGRMACVNSVHKANHPLLEIQS